MFVSDEALAASGERGDDEFFCHHLVTPRSDGVPVLLSTRAHGVAQPVEVFTLSF